MMQSRVPVLAGVIWIGAALAACSGSDSQPPLKLNESNAGTVASEVLIDSGQLSDTTGLTIGGTASGDNLVRLLQPTTSRAAEMLMWHALSPSENAPANPSAAPTVTACGAGGTTTTDGSQTSAKITFDHCSETANVVLDGTVSYSLNASSTALALSVSIDLTVALGSVTIAESGGYALSLDSSQDGFAFDLTSDHLQLSISVGGTTRDQITLSNVKIHTATDTSGMAISDTLSESYEVDSTRLTGHFSVATMAALQVVSDGAHQYPYSGQLTITGGNGTRLVITVIGDETTTPAAGEGQVKLEIDPGTGTLGAAIWTTWGDLAAAASTSST